MKWGRAATNWQTLLVNGTAISLVSDENAGKSSDFRHHKGCPPMPQSFARILRIRGNRAYRRASSLVRQSFDAESPAGHDHAEGGLMARFGLTLTVVRNQSDGYRVITGDANLLAPASAT
jgi:hypothetical protein